MSEQQLDGGWSAAGSAWEPLRNSWEEEDVVSGTKRDLGGGMRPLVCGSWDGCCEPALGLRLRGPEDCVVWEGLAASGLVLWSFLGTDGADSGLWSSWYCSLLSVFPLEVKIKTDFISTNLNNTMILLLKRPLCLFSPLVTVILYIRSRFCIVLFMVQEVCSLFTIRLEELSKFFIVSPSLKTYINIYYRFRVCLF